MIENNKVQKGTYKLKTGLADMLKGGVIMDVVNAEQAKIAEDEPIVSVAESTSFSTCPNSGKTSPVRIRSGLISPATMRS